MKLLLLTQVLDREDPILGFTHGWAAALAKELDRLIVVPLRAGAVDLPANVDVRSLGKESGARGLTLLARFRRVVGGACRRREVDAILAHMVPRYAIYSAPFAVPRRIPLFLWYAHKGVDWSLRLAEPLVRKVFTASARSFRLRSRKKVVTGHGIDTSFFRCADEGGLTHDIAVVGRIAPAKDPMTLVEALGVLAREGRRPTVLLAGGTLLAGHDEYRSQVVARIDRLGLADQFTLLGPVPHPLVRNVFLRAPLFVTPSLTGSVDKTVLEAMACERIPVTCNDSFRDVLGEFWPRLMFAAGDAAGLAARLRELLDTDPADRLRLARKLRGLVLRDHDLTRLARRLVEEISESIQGGRGRRPIVTEESPR